MKKKPQLIPLLNFFAETLRETPELLLRHPPGLWMNLQLDDEFMRADREKGEAIRKEVQPCAA